MPTLTDEQPNWIYTLCNLVGMEGGVAYDAIMNTGRISGLIKEKFHRAFEEDFMNIDGSIVTLRSAISKSSFHRQRSEVRKFQIRVLTFDEAGYPVPGLAGVIGNVGGAMAAVASLPNLARRLWLVSRDVCVRKDENGKYKLENFGM